MKKSTASNHLRRAAAFLLALLLAVPTGYARAGDRKLQTTAVLTDGLTYHNTITENAGSRIESFSLELSPYSRAYPILLQGSGTVYGAATISTAVDYAQRLGYHVLGAVNADFFAVSQGIPIGMVIEDGVYKSSAEEEAAMAIVNGQVRLVDDPQVSLALTNQRTGYRVEPHHLNKWRNASGGIYLLNQDFSAVSTHTSDEGWYVRLGPVGAAAAWPAISTDPASTDPVPTDPASTDPSGTDPSEETDATEETDPAQPETEPSDPAETVPTGEEEFSGEEMEPTAPSLHRQSSLLPELTVNSTLTLEVVEVFYSDQAIPIGEDEYILTASGYADVMNSFQVGDRVTLTASCADPVLSAAQWAGGVGDVMIRNGAVTDSSQWTYTKTGRAPRTALGVKADGTLLIYAADGRQSGYSMGLSQEDLAQEMLAQGCLWAVNLDGGGSTAFSAWIPGQEAVSLLNKPSDGVQRKCATYLLLVTDDAGNGVPSRLALAEDNPVVLAGSRMPLGDAVVLDSGLNVLPLGADSLTAASGGLGTVQDNTYIAGPRAGTDTLTLYDAGLMVMDTVRVHVVEELTGLTVSLAGSAAALSALTVRPGESVQLAAAGVYWGRTALRDFSAVTWTVEGDIGTVDADGVFTMSEYGGSGSITASAGGKSQTIRVTTPYTHTDVTRKHWAYDAVEYCYSHGVVNGISPTEFGPEELVKRGDFVLMFYRAAGQPEVTAPCTFTDVPADIYYARALAWAQNAGLASGGGDGTFRPEEPATREEAFTILRQVMPLLGKACPGGSLTELERFADYEQISEFAREAIATLVAQGIVNGKGSVVDPQGNLTRAEMVTLLHKVLIYTPVTEEPTDPDEPQLPTDLTDPTDPTDPTEEAAEEPAADPAEYTLTLDRAEITLGSADRTTLAAVLDPFPEGAQILWTSSDPSAAPVDQQGVVTNIHPSEEGTDVMITAGWNGLEASCVVHCEPAVFIGTVVDAETGLNVRAAAGLDQPITGGLANGTRVVVVAVTRSGWYHIHYLHTDGYAAEGYVSGDYIRLNRS